MGWKSNQTGAIDSAGIRVKLNAGTEDELLKLLNSTLGRRLDPDSISCGQSW